MVDPLKTASAVARLETGLSQSQFARLMGVSVRTLQEWEQGRRKPSGAAQTLLAIAMCHPDVLCELTPA
jgi:putative transcriptional regulator